MNSLLQLILGACMALNLFALATSRLPTLIRIAGLQGLLLGLLPLLLEAEHLTPPIVLIALASMYGKGVLIPGLLHRAMRSAGIRREIEPFIGVTRSVLLGAAGTVLAVLIAPALPLLPEHRGTLLVPGGLAGVFCGFLLLIGRTKAVSQVCGYLVLENGIYLFGMLLIASMPLLVEAGVLLDLTVAIFVIGIILDRIQRAFDSLDTRKLNVLRE